ncbi:hypothetical protein [Ruegeria sp. A3M17]|uniref:hypothetical protein n=1 Tax=Ruegeria sp. A3M17 TaxID=2267229 RepID=UPI000DE87293|nr:hypothetical protein [Ruegeria sp. A3M17]RBW58715.1 hypothetical protein DS906_07890 [Ruegeria sp. A3M17]
MQCLCAKCQPDELWLDGSVNRGGILTFYDPENGGPLKIERGSCSAFSIERLEDVDDDASISRSASVVLCYVPIENIVVGDTDADAQSSVLLKDIYTDPVAVVRMLGARGFYMCPSATPEEIVGRIRWAVDHYIFEARHKFPVAECSLSLSEAREKQGTL